MKVAVTGATGHIGANLIDALGKRGIRTRALVRLGAQFEHLPGVEDSPGDLTDVASLQRCFEACDTVFHSAAHIAISGSRSDLGLMHEVNVLGTANVIKACLAAGVRRLVWFGSVFALRLPTAGTLIAETSPWLTAGDAGSDYDHSKAQAARLIATHPDLESVGILPTGVFGPLDWRGSLFGKAVVRLANGQLPALVKGAGDWVDARDVAAAALNAATTASASSCYLIGGHHHSLVHFAATISKYTHVRAPRLSVPAWLARALVPVSAPFTGGKRLFTADSLRTLTVFPHVDCSLARTELGYVPRSFDSSIEDTLRWYHNQGLISLP